MNGGPDESVQPGECPLCQAGVALPNLATGGFGVLPILAHHFATTCSATRFTSPAPTATSA